MSKRMLALFAGDRARCGRLRSSDSSDSADTVAESTDTAAPAGTDAPEEVDQTQSGDLTFAMITHSDDGPFWSVVKKGADRRRRGTLGVTLVWKPGVNDAQVMSRTLSQRLRKALMALRPRCQTLMHWYLRCRLP